MDRGECPDTTGSAADFLLSVDRVATEDDGQDSYAELEVLEENWDTVQVFQLCQQTWCVSMAGAIAIGFCAREVESACRVARIPARKLTATAIDVREMGRVAAEALNSRQK